MKSKSLIFKNSPIIGVIFAVALFFVYREIITNMTDLVLIGSFSMLFCGVLFIYAYLFAGAACFSNTKHGWHLGLRKCSRAVIVHGAIGYFLMLFAIMSNLSFKSGIIKSVGTFLFSTLFVTSAIEILCRAIIPFGIIKQFKGTSKSISWSVIITSIIFSICTLYPFITINVLTNIYSLIQFIFNFCALLSLSILLTACYITTRNLLFCIVIRYACVVFLHLYSSIFTLENSVSSGYVENNINFLICYAIYFILLIQCSTGGFKMIKQVMPSRIQRYWCGIDDGKRHHHHHHHRRHSSKYFDDKEFVDTGIDSNKKAEAEATSRAEDKQVTISSYEENISSSHHRKRHSSSKETQTSSETKKSTNNLHSESAEIKNHNRHAPWAD